jgi:SAM-dependent methyltransferase
VRGVPAHPRYGNDRGMEPRYDGHAEWYDDTHRSYAAGSAELLAGLLGPPPRPTLCVDLGCGTGLHAAALRTAGYTVVGLDLSGDQLRIALTRGVRAVRADGRRVPLADGSVATVVMTFLHTDVDDFPLAVAEAARILRPGGRLTYIGTHPAYVSAYVDRRPEAEGTVHLRRGYGDERLHRDPTGTYPMRSRVGSRYLTLTSLLGAFLAQPLRLTSVGEYDTALRPWRPDAADGRIVPWNIAITATAD